MNILTASEIKRENEVLEYPSKPLSVRLEHVSVYYRREIDRPTSFKEFVIRRLKGQVHNEYIKALDDISLDIYRGEVFGIIGRNGAGKSTLLRTISAIMHPTKGRVRVWGKGTTLMGVGVGFHPELTGRENIYLYSAFLGRSQQDTKKLYREIVEFAELEYFIDSPLRTYSTGMTARLGFAVAIVKQPEILIIDEVLAVGDEEFQRKCKNRFQEFMQRSSCVIIVSHNMKTVRELCQRVAWIHKGRIYEIGNSKEVIDDYQQFFSKAKKE